MPLTAPARVQRFKTVDLATWAAAERMFSHLSLLADQAGSIELDADQMRALAEAFYDHACLPFGD